MTETFYFNKKYNFLGENSPRRNTLPREHDAIFKLVVLKNPYEYEDESSTLREWNAAGVSIRQSNFKMCQGSISRTFFQDSSVDDSSVVFLLYFLARTRTRINPELIGFAMTNDLNGDDEDDETLYIDALCANPDVRYVPIGGIKGVGTMLMRQIEWYARDSGEYSILKLSALPYVINYYRKLGFRHIQDCDELQDDAQETYAEEDDAIRTLAQRNMQNRLKSDLFIDKAMRVELAKEKRILGKGNQDYYMSNLNKYFEPYRIKFRIENDALVALNEDNKKDKEVMKLLDEDNSAILELLNMLRGKGFAVACPETQGKNVRHNIKYDSDGDIMFPCDEDGYTMRKCLDIFEEVKLHDRPMRELNELIHADGVKKKYKHRNKTRHRRKNKKRNIKVSRKYNQYGKGMYDSLGEGTGRFSDSRIIFKKDRIIIPIDDNRSIEIKYDDRLCKNWSANIRLPDGKFQYLRADDTAIWIPLKNFNNKYLDYLVSIFNNLNNNLNNDLINDLNNEYSFEKNLIDFLNGRYSDISSIEGERTLLKNPCKTVGGKKKKRKTKRKSIKKYNPRNKTRHRNQTQ
jgi:hypothetical protein